MSATNAYQFDIPDSDIASGFSNGEKALTFATPINSVPPRTYWYLSRFILLDGGNYTLKINASDPFQFSIGPSQNNTRRVIAADKQSGFPWQADFFVRGGRQRIDIQMFNVWLPSDPYAVNPTAQPSSCYVAFSLWKNGNLVYASTADEWSFDSTWLADSALAATSDPRMSLPVWTIPPNWDSGVLETLTFDTEIFDSERESEQRRSLARHPRRSVEASFLRAGINTQRINEFLVGVGSRKFLVPFWPEQMSIPVPLSIGDNSFHFNAHDLDGREFYSGGAFILTNGDPTVYEVFTYELLIGTDEAVTMAFYGGCQKEWPLGSRITPLYTAYLDEAPEMQFVTSTIATATLRFLYYETVKTLEPSWGYCAPLWRFKLDWSDTWSESFRRNTAKLDTSIGPVDVVDASGLTRIGQSVKLNLIGRDKVNAFRGFVAMARGKCVRFWMPTHHHDITPVGSSIGGTSLSAIPSGYVDWIVDPQDTRVMMQIEFTSGAPTLYRRLNGVQRSGGFDVFTFDETLPTIQMVDVLRISFVMPMRFDTDSFELNHIVDDLGAVTAVPTLMSTEVTDMPPIECWVTSRPYPIVEVEEFKASAIVKSGRNPYIFDEITASAVVTGGHSNSFSFGSYTVDAEELTASAVVTGGSSTSFTYGSYTTDNEQLTAQATITSVTFPNQLITYTIPAESFNATAVVTGGTLS